MKPSPKTQLIVTLITEDEMGALLRVLQTLHYCNCNILDSTVSKLGQYYSMALLINGSWSGIAKFEAHLQTLESKLKIKSLCQRTAPTWPREDCLPYSISLTLIDRPGVLFELSNFLNGVSVQINDIQIQSQANQKTTIDMSTITLNLNVPISASLSSLREQFVLWCDERNLDGYLEPVKQ